MFGVRVLLAVVVGEQHDKVRHEIGQRMNAVGNQSLGPGQHADGDLGEAEQSIDDDADPGAARCHGCACLRAVFSMCMIIGGVEECHGIRCGNRDQIGRHGCRGFKSTPCTELWHDRRVTIRGQSLCKQLFRLEQREQTHQRKNSRGHRVNQFHRNSRGELVADENRRHIGHQHAQRRPGDWTGKYIRHSR